MGYEIIGQCHSSEEDSGLKSYEIEAPVKYIKESCANPPFGVDVEIMYQDHELGSYPVIAVVWDDYETSYPDEYISKCMEAYEKFTLPKEVHERYRLLSEVQKETHSLIERALDAGRRNRKR
jgi:hypothetical protein